MAYLKIPSLSQSNFSTFRTLYLSITLLLKFTILHIQTIKNNSGQSVPDRELDTSIYIPFFSQFQCNERWGEIYNHVKSRFGDSSKPRILTYFGKTESREDCIDCAAWREPQPRICAEGWSGGGSHCPAVLEHSWWWRWSGSRAKSGWLTNRWAELLPGSCSQKHGPPLISHPYPYKESEATTRKEEASHCGCWSPRIKPSSFCHWNKW